MPENARFNSWSSRISQNKASWRCVLLCSTCNLKMPDSLLSMTRTNSTWLAQQLINQLSANASGTTGHNDALPYQ